MLESLAILGSIIFFGVLTYAFQMRRRKYKKYSNSCDVLYYPEKDKMNIIDPKNYKSSPYKLTSPGPYSLLFERSEESIFDINN